MPVTLIGEGATPDQSNPRKGQAMTDILKRVREFETGRKGEGDTLTRVRQCEREAFQTAREATKTLLDATNVMGAERAVVAGVVAGLLETHRYLQSQGILAILEALGSFGKIGGREDARNAHAKATCAMLPEALRERIYWKD
jgi:hypothetical protein